MLEEKTIIDSITYRGSGHIEIREALLVLKDGIEIAKTYHRHVLEPGQDPANEHEDVRAIAEAMQPQREAAAERIRLERERHPRPGTGGIRP